MSSQQPPPTGSRAPRSTTQVVIGGLLIAFGVLLMLDRLDVVGVGAALSQLWPFAIIIPGLLGLWTTRGRSIGPYIVLVVGAAFLASTQGLIPTDWPRYAWPLIFVVAGVVVLIGALDRRRPDDAALVNVTAMLGGAERQLTSQTFRGGHVTLIMGGAEVDLSQARPVEGGAVLRVFALMGGADIAVPVDWHVEMRGFPILGGFDDSRRGRPGGANTPDLVIYATTIMGGVDIVSPD